MAKASNPFERKHSEIYVEYQARLQKAGAMDFDDLLMKVVELFRQHPEVLEKYQRRFQHILIDEYQDTNMAQNEIALLLAADHRQITIVGDGDQCLPPGTLVRTPDGEVPIERLAVGDVVLGTGGKRALHAGVGPPRQDGHVPWAGRSRGRRRPRGRRHAPPPRAGGARSRLPITTSCT